MTFEEFKNEHIYISHDKRVDDLMGQTVFRTSVSLKDACYVENRVNDKVLEKYGDIAVKHAWEESDKLATEAMWNFLKKEFGTSVAIDPWKEDDNRETIRKSMLSIGKFIGSTVSPFEYADLVNALRNVGAIDNKTFEELLCNSSLYGGRFE